MKKIFDKQTGKLVEVQLYRTEQHMLMKQNIKKLKDSKKVVPINGKVSK